MRGSDVWPTQLAATEELPLGHRVAVRPAGARRSAIAKRSLDLIVVLLASVVWAPVLGIAALLVLVLEGRPVFYVSQRQVGPGVVAPIMKLRTMKRGADKILNRETVPIAGTRFLNIPRTSPVYTPIVRWIERLALTELRQLLHVLTGRMSLVGARPLPKRVMEELLQLDPDAADRFLTRPGLTGPVQMIGRDRLADEDRLRLEKEYCRLASGPHYSVLLDLSLLAATVLLVINPRWLMTVDEAHAWMRRMTREPAPIVEPVAGTLGAD
jgi:lipopolysaccharide/colanic/teichoic acid biosynthesis glycosyltransferase